jgi:hypothetical protein
MEREELEYEEKMDEERWNITKGEREERDLK